MNRRGMTTYQCYQSSNRKQLETIPLSLDGVEFIVEYSLSVGLRMPQTNTRKRRTDKNDQPTDQEERTNENEDMTKRLADRPTARTSEQTNERSNNKRMNDQPTDRMNE